MGTNPKNLAGRIQTPCGEMLRYSSRKLRCTHVLSMTPQQATGPVGFMGSFAALRMSAGAQAAVRFMGFFATLSMTPPTLPRPHTTQKREVALSFLLCGYFWVKGDLPSVSKFYSATTGSPYQVIASVLVSIVIVVFPSPFWFVPNVPSSTLSA